MAATFIGIAETFDLSVLGCTIGGSIVPFVPKFVGNAETLKVAEPLPLPK